MNRFNAAAAGLGLFSIALGFGPAKANAIGWPQNYEGVMLQGFYWDSYDDTKWTNLESQADELSQYFKLIWIPNSGNCEYMGYMPRYWFTNHNSAFGTEQELLSMISTFKEKGTGFIADVVINHRNGVTNWYDFPVEEWNGQTWKIGLEGICSNDEMAYASGQPKPTGNPDTGDNFDGCRDLDHTNANVQNNCKNYVKCLQDKYGYVGMRYDMVKGYGGQYNKIYNEYSNVEYSVGEYWDSNYDAVAAWIEATGKTSAAFDFPCKYAINEAFSSGDMTKLVWKANGTTDQPAGMIHHWYQRYSVTFVDNHDTYRDGSKFTGNVIAANAFILMSPGTPCVFLPHYQEYKAEIQQLVNIRNSVGINNQSSVTVLQSSYNCYMAEITGSKGKAVVKIGGAMVSPSGYSDSDIKAAGNDYCVWTKVGVDVPDPTPQTPDHLYLMGNLKDLSWSTSASPEMTKSGDKFTITATFEAAEGETYCYFNLTDALGKDWAALNAVANRFGASEEGTIVKDNESTNIVKYAGATSANVKSWMILPGTYTLTADFSGMTLSIGEGSDIEVDNDPMPANFYIIGQANGNDWAYDTGVKMDKNETGFVATVEFAQVLPVARAQADPYAYFSFAKSLADSWDSLNVAGNRFAPAADMELIPDGSAATLEASSNPAEAKAYKVMPGKYDVEIDWKNKKIQLRTAISSGVEAPLYDADNAVYYNLQGERVASPVKGVIYIRVSNGKAVKVIY